MSDTLEKRAHEIFRDWTLHCASKSTVQVIVEFARAELLKAAETARLEAVERETERSQPYVSGETYRLLSAKREQAKHIQMLIERQAL